MKLLLPIESSLSHPFLPKMQPDFSKHWKQEMIDIHLDHLKIVKCILKKHVPDYEVRVFGSRMTGSAKKYSDLDLIVIGEQAVDQDRFRLLKEAFEVSILPFRVDVLDWNIISPSFQCVIEKQYEVIQNKNCKCNN
jgi:uncharacterized protein